MRMPLGGAGAPRNSSDRRRCICTRLSPQPVAPRPPNLWPCAPPTKRRTLCSRVGTRAGGCSWWTLGAWQQRAARAATLALWAPPLWAPTASWPRVREGGHGVLAAAAAAPQVLTTQRVAGACPTTAAAAPCDLHAAPPSLPPP